MKKTFILLGILYIFISCNTFSNIKINVNILNTNEEIILKNESGKYVYGLYCKINGSVNGYLEIEFTNGENMTKIIFPENGVINFIYEGDWYADEFKVIITSNGDTSGYLNIIYNFKLLY